MSLRRHNNTSHVTATLTPGGLTGTTRTHRVHALAFQPRPLQVVGFLCHVQPLPALADALVDLRLGQVLLLHCLVEIKVKQQVGRPEDSGEGLDQHEASHRILLPSWNGIHLQSIMICHCSPLLSYIQMIHMLPLCFYCDCCLYSSQHGDILNSGIIVPWYTVTVMLRRV